MSVAEANDVGVLLPAGILCEIVAVRAELYHSERDASAAERISATISSDERINIFRVVLRCHGHSQRNKQGHYHQEVSYFHIYLVSE